MLPSDVGWTIHGADIKATVLRLSRSDAHITKETWRRREVKNHVFRYNSTSWQPFSHPIFAFGCLSDSGYLHNFGDGWKLPWKFVFSALKQSL